jgi:3-hydroxybutyryl-CoA dehydratase
MSAMRFDELSVGQAVTLERTVTDGDVVAYAGITGDDNPVHLDEVVAAKSRFGGRIAHGMLSAGFISAAIGTRLPGPGSIYLGQTLKFTAPVRIGDTVTTRVEVLELVPEKRRVKLATRCTTQRGEMVIDGEALVMVPDE